MSRLIGVEAGGRGTALGEHAARFQKNGGGVPGVLQGTYSYVLQNDAGQVATTHSVSAGLDYASVGPEHAMLHDSGRATYTSRPMMKRWTATSALSRTEGILPALESRARRGRGHQAGAEDGQGQDHDGERERARR
jgi:tryptophan synthase beta chain